MTQAHDAAAARRQFVYWRTLTEALGDEATSKRTEPLMQGVVGDLGLPKLTLDPRASVNQVLRQDPSLVPFAVMPGEEDSLAPGSDEALKRTILCLKAVLNVFGKTPGEEVSAEEYSQWLEDVRAFERAAGYEPGGLHRAAGSGNAPGSKGRGGGTGRSPTGTGGGPEMTEQDIDEALSEIKKGAGLMSVPELQAGLQGMERRLIDRMKLREVLADAKLARKLTPSMALTEQLLKDKDHLTGPALQNAKELIKRFVEELGDVLAREVAAASRGEIDRSVPPKRIFRNLDLKRTIWKNLTHWDPETERLYVERLFYRQHTRKQNKTRLIVVVDQSGSMVPAMVNCTILAGIFSALPKIEAHLIAYDTTALDLSPWVSDPFEVLLRTKLGGGTDGTCAMPFVYSKIVDPKNTVIAWISDFYDNRALMPMFTGLVRSGVNFIPVGSVSSSGYFSVDSWFRTELKALGTPVLSGSLRTLVRELKAALP